MSSKSVQTDSKASKDYPRALVYPIIILTLGAAAIHLAVAPDHLQEYLPYGIFFLVVGLAQAALAVAMLVRPSRRVFAAVALIAVGCVVIWIISRTVGLPFGPSEKLENIQLADPLTLLLQIATANGQLAGVITSLLEIVAALLCGLLLWRGLRIRRRNWWSLAATIPVSILAILLATAGVAVAQNPLPDALNMSTAVPGQPSISMDTLTEAPGAQPVKSFTLTARVATVDGQEAWTYNGTVPGPELRVNQGDRVRITLINHLPASTSIHWHGLRLPNAEDGVAGVTQDAVPVGGTYTYEFVVKDPGTYWYHSHQDTEHQVPRGLYGALVVEPQAQGPHYDRDYAVTFGDSNSPGVLHLDAQPGQLVRLRLVNAYQEDMTGYPELLVLAGAPYQVIALDGHDLNQPQTLGLEKLPVGPGQRYDLAFRMPQTGQVALYDLRPRTGTRVPQQEWLTLGAGGTGAAPIPEEANLPTFDLTSYGAPAPDPVASRTSFDVSKELRISSQVGFRYGSYEFVHMFNGKPFPDTEPIIVRPGQFVRLHLINDTDEYHPIHLHGHFFSVLSRNGKPLSGSPVHLDSVLLGPHETWDVAFLADNPGLWMLHCHVLIHAAYGLSTMVSYEGISTPYSIGTGSGNFPE
jgi:FtsP/CotA-like multicopper oxidase with cupredoxin domain